MVNLKEEIIEQLELKNETHVSHLITNSFTTHKLLNNMLLEKPRTEFKIPKFLLGIKPIVNEIPKRDIMDKTVQLIVLVLEKIGIELSPEEAFVLYQLKDLGKFRLKDSKLFQDLEKEYSTHSAFRVEKSEFKQILIELKNVGLIELRKGSIMLSERVMID